MAEREKEWTVLSMLEWATDYFEKKDVPSPRLSIEWLLADMLGVKRLDLYLKFDRPLYPDELEKLRPVIKRRGLHEPLQYITGSADFVNCRIDVNPSVLIPRVETEQLVELILKDFQARADEVLHVLDIGTGSGCIPIAIAKAHPRWKCAGVDISERALKLAEKNAACNKVKVEFLKEDLHTLGNNNQLQNRKFDIVVSNPPYILPDDRKTLDKQVLEYEPEEALFHKNPLGLYQQIGNYAFTTLSEAGRLYLECNHKFTWDIKNNLGNSFPIVDILPDYDERERFIRALKSV